LNSEQGLSFDVVQLSQIMYERCEQKKDKDNTKNVINVSRFFLCVLVFHFLIDARTNPMFAIA
jgi:hypothetical protein